MKVRFNPTEDTIMSFGPALAGDNIFDGPDDFTFERYSYESEESGVFNPNGFSLRDSSEKQGYIESFKNFMQAELSEEEYLKFEISMEYVFIAYLNNI